MKQDPRSRAAEARGGRTHTRRGLLALGGGLCVAPAFGQEPDVTGDWTGVLEAGSQRLRLRFVFGADGRVSLYSLDQGGAEIPARRLDRPWPEIRVEVKAVGGSFAGRVVSATRIEGIWKQGGELPLVLLRGESGLEATAAAVLPLTTADLESLRQQSQAPALAAAALVGDQRRHWVAGKRELPRGAAVSEGDLWHLGSITKSFTATLVARFVDAGLISFDDTVEQHLGEVAPRMQSAYRGATFRHLLSHRAGVPGALPLLKMAGYALRGSRDLREQRRDWARDALALPAAGALGQHFEYSNNGYVVAGAMLEAAFDQSWEQLLRSQVLEPLGLKSAGFGAPPGKQPRGHADLGGNPLTQWLRAHVLEAKSPDESGSDNPPVLGPAGTLHMSLDDVLSYLAAHRDRPAFLRPETWRTLHTPPFGGEYALGWIRRPDGSLWHNGSNTLWYAEVLVNTAQQRCAVVATNEARPPAQLAVGKALMRALAS